MSELCNFPLPQTTSTHHHEEQIYQDIHKDICYLILRYNLTKDVVILNTLANDIMNVVKNLMSTKTAAQSRESVVGLGSRYVVSLVRQGLSSINTKHFDKMLINFAQKQVEDLRAEISLGESEDDDFILKAKSTIEELELLIEVGNAKLSDTRGQVSLPARRPRL